MTTQREYSEILDDLTELLNSNKRKFEGVNKAQRFKELIFELPHEVSTKYLKGLMITKNNIKKSYILRNLISLAGLRTQKHNRYFKAEDLAIYKVDVNEWGRNKWGEACLKNSRRQTIGRPIKYHKLEVIYTIVQAE